MDRMKELVELLNYYAKCYYTMDAPVVSDAEYDLLYDELKSLEEFTGVVLPNSPTKRIGDQTLKEFKQYPHSHKLYSMDKCQSREEFVKWTERTQKALGYFPELTVEYKFDGLTINLVYDGGKLSAAATRGNGSVGEDVTAQIKTVNGVPNSISDTGHIEVQGEGIIKLSVLEKYNTENPFDQLKNARNAAAGAIRNLNPQVTAKRNLDIMCYNVYGDTDLKTQADMRDYIVKNGFECADYFTVVKTANEALEEINKIEEIRPKLDFLIDGIVFKVNNTRARLELGETEKFPKWAVAFKFKAEEATTIVKDVIWQVGRTSKLTPLAILEPVELAGVTVKRATLNNLADIRKKDVKIGSRVFIRRSNDVIPEILGVAEHFSNSKEIIKPKVCPACGSPVVEDGVFLYCTNKFNCVPQIVAKLSHFAEKAAMDIDGYSEKTAEQLLNDLNVRNFADIYKLRASDLSALDGFQQKKAENLVKAIEKSKRVTLAKFIYALGIQGVGVKAAKQLASRFKSIDNLINASVEQIDEIDDFGDITAKYVYDYFKNSDNLEQLRLLIEAGVTISDEKNFEGVFSGKNVVLTGSLTNYKRSDAARLIEERGGTISASVGKSVNLVVAGEEPGSKLDKAQKLGIEIIDEIRFSELLKQ